MSNNDPSPGTRPLEQLKVAELRDELRKRGMNLKGVKKELFERLEEAIKKENQEGVVHGEHPSTNEREPNTGTGDDHEDVEGDEETLDGPTEEASKSEGATVACQSNVLLETSFPIAEESIVTSDGMQTLPEASALNDDGQQVSSTGGADVGAYNNVMLVTNAVSGKGDTNMVCESVLKAADALEPSKNINGSEHDEHVKDEEPAVVTPESAKSERSDAVGDDIGVNAEKEAAIVSADLEKNERSGDDREDGLAGDAPGDVISEVAAPPIENLDPYMASSNTFSTNIANENLGGHDAHKNDVGKPDIKSDAEIAKLTDDQLPRFDSSLQKSFTEAFEEGSNASLQKSFTEAFEEGSVQPMMQQSESTELVDVSRIDEVGLRMESSFVSSSHSVACQQVSEPSAGLKSVDVEGHNINERGFITTEETTNVKVEQPVKCDAINVLISDVKVESMDVETGLESKEALTSAAKMESQTHREDHTELLQVKDEISDLANSQKGMGEEMDHRVQVDVRKDKDDDAEMRPTEDIPQARINRKRKDDESDAIQQEPAKRMRRWNSGKGPVADGFKPLTTDSMKEIILPDAPESFSPAAPRLTPKAVATSRPFPSKVKVEPDPINSIRTVPPSSRALSNSLKVERFVRPFTLKAAKDLLAEYGQCVNFWMDQIKTHCYVTYSSVNEAVAARKGLYGRQWPESVGNCLIADFVDAKEVKMRCEGLMENAQSAPTTALMRVSTPTQVPTPRGAFSSLPNRNESMALSSPRFSREAQQPPVFKKDPEPPVVTLEDLFYKTKAKPHIYYLPLTDEQVAEKLKKQQVVR